MNSSPQANSIRRDSDCGACRGRLALFAALIPLAACYGLTVCPVIYWGDGMELAAAARCLGVAHPTGYPLYVMLGRVFLAIPFGDPGWRINLFSVCSALAAAGFFYGLIGELARLARRGNGGDGANEWPTLALRAAAALAFGLSRFVWGHAVMAEVYAPMLAVFTGCIWLAARAARTGNSRDALALALVYGLAWQCHLLAAVLAPLVGAVLIRVWLAAARSGFKSAAKAAAAATLCFGVGLSGYLALPIRARANPPMNWGDPSTPARFFAHVMGGQFRQTKVLTLAGGGQPLNPYQMRRYWRWQPARAASWAVMQFVPLELFAGDDSRSEGFWRYIVGGEGAPAGARAVAALGLGAAFWSIALLGAGLAAARLPAFGLGALGTLAAGFAALFLYSIPDIPPYFLSIWPLAFGLFWIGAVWLAANRKRASPGAPPLAAALAAACALLAFRSNYAACDLSTYTEADEYGERLMNALPDDALLLAADDNTIFAAWYQQVVKGRKPSVAVYGLNFIVHSWYARYFEHPGLEDVRVFARDMNPGFEADWLVAVGGGVIIPNLERRPIFAALSDGWQKDTILRYWNGEPVAQLWKRRIDHPADAGQARAPALHRLHDNPAYNEYQRRQFQEMYGQAGEESDSNGEI